jgi:hypothetical protein
MMPTPEIFVCTLALVLALLFRWAFRALPRERWQFLGAVPLRPDGCGGWQGLNLTTYGLFNAAGAVLGTAALFVLLGAAGVPAAAAGLLLTAILAAAIPAARMVAGWVEGKAHTLSVAGAFGVGMLLAPPMVWLLDLHLGPRLGFTLPMQSAMAALAVAYCLGEGLGRLACISFGCCYGRPLASLPAPWRGLLGGVCFRFAGQTKKISYASGLEGRRVVPVQAMSAVLLCGLGLIGLLLFLQGGHRAAFLIPLAGSQVWRFASEFLRADHRGGGRLSAYQKGALLALPYAAALALLSPEAGGLGAEALARGLAALWNPAVLLGLQLVGLAIFLYTGRSRVTASTLRFHVVPGRT